MFKPWQLWKAVTCVSHAGQVGNIQRPRLKRPAISIVILCKWRNVTRPKLKSCSGCCCCWWGSGFVVRCGGQKQLEALKLFELLWAHSSHPVIVPLIQKLRLGCESPSSIAASKNRAIFVCWKKKRSKLTDTFWNRHKILSPSTTNQKWFCRVASNILIWGTSRGRKFPRRGSILSSCETLKKCSFERGLDG